jgi:hypothetical protein
MISQYTAFKLGQRRIVSFRIPVFDFYGKIKGNLTGIMRGQHPPVWSILLTFKKMDGTVMLVVEDADNFPGDGMVPSSTHSRLTNGNAGLCSPMSSFIFV